MAGSVVNIKSILGDQGLNFLSQLIQVTYTNQYNLQGGLTQVTDHLSNITTMSYDLLGRKTAMTDSDMGSWTYQYDPVGNLMAQRDGRAQWLHLAYDNLNRLTKQTTQYNWRPTDR